jgi:hypothetical protein
MLRVMSKISNLLFFTAALNHTFFETCECESIKIYVIFFKVFRQYLELESPTLPRNSSILWRPVEHLSRLNSMAVAYCFLYKNLS